MNEEMQYGADLANKLMPVILQCAIYSGDRKQWWAGFLACVAGGAAADMGPEAIEILAAAISEAAKEALKNKLQ